MWRTGRIIASCWSSTSRSTTCTRCSGFSFPGEILRRVCAFSFEFRVSSCELKRGAWGIALFGELGSGGDAEREGVGWDVAGSEGERAEHGVRADPCTGEYGGVVAD